MRIDKSQEVLFFMTALLFSISTIAWTFSWFAVKIQSGSDVPAMLSIFYRFILASAILFAVALFKKDRLKITTSEVKYCCAIGLNHFCINYALVYWAMHYIASGMVAIISASAVVLSEIITSIWHKKRPSKRTLIAGSVGFCGIALFSYSGISIGEDLWAVIAGIALTLVGEVFHIFGSMFFTSNSKVNKTPTVTIVAYASFFGALAALIINLICFKTNHWVDFSLQYIGSLAYLVIIASVVAFLSYYKLNITIGIAKTNYITLVYPVLAMTVSSHYEGYIWTWFAVAGIMVLLSSLIIEFAKSFTTNRIN